MSFWDRSIQPPPLLNLFVSIFSPNKGLFGNLDAHIDSLWSVVNDLDLSTNIHILHAPEMESISKALADLWSLLWIKDSPLCQRVKARWLKDSDANSSFSHASVNSRNRGNIILALKKWEGYIEGVVEIWNKILSYFSNRFKDPDITHPRLDRVAFRACVFFVNLTVLVNGSPTPEIRIQRRLK